MRSNKCLYITLQPMVSGDGASDKAIAQKNAISKIGIECHIAYLTNSESGFILHLDGEKVAEIQRYSEIFKPLFKIVTTLDVNTIYLRYVVMATYDFNNFMKLSKARGIKIYLEIPTYPYDGEADLSSFKRAYGIYRERFFRRFLHKYVYRIVTYSLDKVIFKAPTIQLSNAPARALPVTKSVRDSSSFRMIAVANLAFWHGYDRLIRGLANYYENNPDYKVYLTLVGKGNAVIYNELENLVKEKALSKYVHFVGQKANKELDEYFNNADLAIGCLGCHRKKIYEVKSLKNVEYAMRGLPFIYSESNSDFDDKPYVLREPADESDIDIKRIIEFADSLKMSAQEISESVKEYTWENQMRKVFCS